MSRKKGRKLELNQAVIDEFVKVFHGGATIKDACMYIGVAESTYFNWMKQGEKDRNKEPQTIYVDFLEQVQRARAKMRIQASTHLQLLGKKDAKALMFLLERSDPENWGKRSTLKIEGGLPVDLVNTLIRAMVEQGLDPEQAIKDMLAELANG